MKNYLKSAIILLLGLGLLAACGRNEEKTATSTTTESSTAAVTDQPLRIGILPAESAIPIILAKEQGYFYDLVLIVEI